MSLKILPTFKGYVVDARLRQFRRLDPVEGYEFIEFYSEKGRQLRKELAQEGLSTQARVIKNRREREAERAAETESSNN